MMLISKEKPMVFTFWVRMLSDPQSKPSCLALKCKPKTDNYQLNNIRLPRILNSFGN